jgi:HlyD family secretion protein
MMQTDNRRPSAWHRRAGLRWILVVAAVAVVVYRAKTRPLPVAGWEITTGPIQAEVLGTGTLEARLRTTISPRIQERLAEVLVDQNDVVKAGQLLARLEDGELQRQVEVAEAAWASAQASAQRVRLDVTRAQAVEHQARLDHQRIAGLLTNQISSQADFDKAVEQLNVATADLQRAQAAIVEAERQVITAEKNLAYQRERLGFTQILSPYDGLIVRRDRDPGGVVVPGSSVLQLISTNELWASAWVDETAMANLATGQTARVVFRSEPARTYPGAVARLGREADRETREFLVDVRLAELPQNWAVGQRAEVFIETGRAHEALTLPQAFVQWREGRPGVFVHNRGRARWRAVQLGLSGREQVAITQGVAAGDTVLRTRDGREELREGRRVRVEFAGSAQTGVAP